MPLLAILIAALVLLAACSIGGERTLRFFVDVSALICVLTPIIGYAICKGFKPFGKGLSAMRFTRTRKLYRVTLVHTIEGNQITFPQNVKPGLRPFTETVKALD